MKKALLLVLVFLVYGQLSAQESSFSHVEVLSSDAASTTLKFTVDGYLSKTVTTPNGQASIIDIESGTPMLKAGAPDLPKLVESIIIDDLSNTIITVSPGAYTDYQNIEVAPSKGNLYRDVDPSTVAYDYGAIYQEDAFFPQNLAVLRDPFIFNDFRGQTIVTHPIQYNPVSKVLRVYNELIVTVKSVEGVGLNPLYREAGAIKVKDDFQMLYNARFINLAAQANRYEQVSELGNMLVICPDHMMPTIEPLVEWKKQKGIPIEVVDIAAIGTTSFDLDSYVTDYYNDNGLTYLLLVGDENMIPTAQTPGNNACDHCYGYKAGSDHYAEIFVGRLNAENEEELQTMVDRTLIYEKNPSVENPNWFSTGLGFGSAEGPGDDGEWDFEHLNNLKIQMLDYEYTSVWEFYDGSQGSSSPTPGDITSDESGNPATSSINDAVNQGLSIMNYTGHGDHGVLASGGFNNAAINSLTNTGMYPFLIAVACCVGDFQNDFGSGPCLGDVWIRAKDDMTGEPTGGIGGCFSSILQSWSPPMEGQDEMMSLITQNAQYDIRHTLGGIVIHGCGSMIDEYAGGGEEMADTWNIFGDPSVVLWTALPTELNVSHVPVINVGSSQLDVFVDVEDAMVGLYYQGEILGTGLVSGGVANISFDPVVDPDQITVTVTAYNRMPYQGPVDVIVAQGPYVVLDEFMLNDPSGNNNQLADYGESVLMDVNLENVGVELAPGVTATLSTTDPNVTITDNAGDWGDIANNDATLLIEAFAFDVNELIVDQHTVLFNLEIASGSDAWNASIPVTLNAPALGTDAYYTIDDSANGNGNGRMESGETVELILKTRNLGHATSPDAMAVLAEISGADVTITNANQSIGEIASDGEWIEVSYTLEIGQDLDFMTPVDLTWNINAAPYSVDAEYSGIINIIVEDFELVNFEQYEWLNESPSPWFITNLYPYEGAYCTQSGDIDNNQETNLDLTLTVIQEGTISFSRRTSCEEGWDFLEFYIDGDMMGQWSGDSDWESVSFPVTEGEHTFRWQYNKDDIISSGQDAAWIDEIILPLFEMEPIIDGIEDLANQGDMLQVFPSLTAGPLNTTFKLEQAAQVQIALFGTNGQQLRMLMDAQQLNAGDYQEIHDLSNLPAGTYFVGLQVDNGWYMQKVVKQ